MPLPPRVSPWPENVKEPQRLSPPAVTRLADGLYGSCHPDGRLRLLARVGEGRVRQWLVLAEDGASGSLDTGHYAQTYANGMLENFSPWDDSSPPFATTLTLQQWADQQVKLMLTPPAPLPDADIRKVLKRSYPEGMEYPISGAVAPPELGELLEQLAKAPGSCDCPDAFNRWLDYSQQVGPELARDLTNMAPAACLQVAGRHAWETFLYPSFQGLGGFREANLQSLPLYQELMRMAASRKGQRWVSRATGSVSARMLDARWPQPIFWCNPKEPSRWCGFRLAMILSELLLRQEMSCQSDLAGMVGEADREEFIFLGSVIGAWLHAPVGHCYPFEKRLPWSKHPEALARVREALASLLSSLEPGPLIDALDKWLNGRLPASPGVYRLGRFFNARRRRMGERLASWSARKMHWDYIEPQGWPEPEATACQTRRFEWRERFEQVWAILEPVEAPGAGQPPALGPAQHRAAVAGAALAGGEQEYPKDAEEFLAFLEAHPSLSAVHRKALQRVAGFPVEPGPGYTRLLGIGFWILERFEPKGVDPRRATELAVDWTHGVLSRF